MPELRAAAAAAVVMETAVDGGDGTLGIPSVIRISALGTFRLVEFKT